MKKTRRTWKWLLALALTAVLCIAACTALAAEMTLPEPSSVVMPGLVTPGNDVTVSFPVGKNISSYKLAVKDSDGWSTVKAATSTAQSGSVTFTIEKSVLQAGHIYTVEVAAYGAEGSDAKGITFWNSILNVAPTSVNDISFFFNQQNPQIGYMQYVTAYAPGASQIWVDMDGDTFQGWSPDHVTLVNAFQETGTHIMTATAMFDDGTKKTETFEVTVSAAAGELYNANTTPVTYAIGNQNGALTEFPEIITIDDETGTDETVFSLTINKVTADVGAENNVWYTSWLYDMTADTEIELPFFKKQQDPYIPEVTLLGNAQTVTVEAGKLTSGHSYVLGAEITASGYKAYTTNQRFTVLPTPTSTGNEQTLSFMENLQSGDNWDIYDGFTMVLSVSGAKPTLVRLWLDDHYEYMPWDQNSDSMDFGYNTWSLGEHTYFFQAYYGNDHTSGKAWDEVAWNPADISNLLKLNAVQNTATTKAPTYDALSNTYTRGDYITVNLTNVDSIPKNAYIGADLYQNGSDNCGHYETNDRKSITVSTAQLEPGYYALLVYTETPGAGYASTIHHFQVLPPASEPQNEFYFTTSKTEVQSYEYFTVTFHAPDREGYMKTYRFFDGQSYWEDEWYGEDFVNIFVDVDPGSWDLHADVYYWPDNDGDPEVYQSNVITVTGSTKGDAGITVNAPSLFQLTKAENEGEYAPYAFTINYPDGIQDLTQGRYWRIELEHSGFDLDSERGDYVKTEYEIPASYFSKHGIYTLRVHINVLGYNSFEKEIPVVVTGATQGDQGTISVAVNGQSQDLTINSSTDFNVKVNYSSRPTAVRILREDYWDFMYGWDDEEPFYRRWNFGEGDMLIYAEATWTELDIKTLDQNDWQVDDGKGGTRDFDWSNDVDWTASSNTVLVHLDSPYGELKAPDFSLAKTSVNWGEDLVVTVADAVPTDTNGKQVNVGWFFGNVFQKKYGEGGDFWWENVNHGNQYEILGGRNAIPTYSLDENGGEFQIEIGADGPGWNGNSKRLDFTLGKKTQPVEARFTVNGDVKPVTVSTAVNVQLAAYHPQAGWYEVEITQDGDENYYDSRSGGDGMLLDTWQADHAGTFILTAYAYSDTAFGEDKRVEIGTITVTATANKGDLNAPDVTMTNLSAPDVTMTNLAMVGDQIAITFAEDPSVESYSYWVHRAGDGNWIAGDKRNGAGTLTLDTSIMESGVYLVELDTRAIGFNQGHKTLNLVLFDDTETIDSKEGYTFIISDETVTTQTGVHMIAYVPDAKHVYIHSQKVTENSNEPMKEIDSCEGSGLETWFGSSYSGSYKVYLSWDRQEPVQVATVTVSAKDNLTGPVISVNGTSSGTTVTVDPNDPHTLHVVISSVENAESYFVQVRRTDWDGHFYREGHHISEFTNEGQLVLTITDEEAVQPGRMYEVICDTHADNYNSGSSCWTFLLQDSSITSSVNLNVEGKDKYWLSDNVHVTASANGATAIRIFANKDDIWFRGDQAETDFTLWDQDTLFYAYATTEDLPQNDNDVDPDSLNWTLQSVAVPIHAETEGDTEVPSLTFTSPVTKGDWFVFTIGNDGNARQMDLRILDDYDNEVEFRRYWAPGTYRLPTANLNPEQRYRVHLNCIQDRHQWTTGPDKLLFVDAPSQDTAFFRMDKTEVYVEEPFIPTVYAPGAVEVKVELGGGIWGKWDSNNGTNDAEWEWILDEAGTHDFIAYARYSENGEWQIIDTVQMTVKEPIPLETSTISVRNPIDVTQDIIVTVHTVPYGTSYVVEAHSHAEDGKEWPRWEMHDTDAVDGIITVTIHANMLTANEAYWIDCYVDSEHNDYAHGKSENHVGIMTLSGNSTDTNVHLSFKDDSTVRTKEVPVNTGFSVNVSTTESGVTAVALYMGDRIQYQFYNGEALEFTLSDYQPWQETIFARTYKETDINGKPWEEIDWYHLNWENASEERLSVTFTSKGKADPATINFPGTVIREDPIVINVTLGNNANEAHANLDRSSGHGEEDLVFDNWFDLIPGENTITLPTGNLECGWYKLYVDSSGEGYENNRTSGWVHIAPDPDKVSQKLVLPSGLTEIDEEAFEGTAAEMVVIPASVQSIGSKAFANSRIHLVVLKGNVPDIAGNAFENCELVVVYGPEGSAVDLANAFGAAFYRTN